MSGLAMHRFPQAVLLHQQGRNAEARQLCVTLLKVQPSNPRVLALHGATCAVLGLHEEALDSFNKALRLDDSHAPLHFMLANLLRERGQLRPAIASYRRAIERRSEFADAWSNLGLTHYDLGEFDVAAQCFQHALRYGTDQWFIWYNLGNALQKLECYADTVVAYERALLVNPDNIDIRFNLGNVLMKLSNPQAAIEQYQYALQTRPEDGRLLANCGAALRRAGFLLEARSVLQRAISLKADSLMPLLTLANVLQDLGDLPAAITTLQAAIRIAPDNMDAFFNLGNVLVAAKQPEAAYDAFKHCIEHSPDNLSYLGTLAGTQATLWRTAEVAQTWLKLLERWSDDVAVPVDIVIEHSDDPLLHQQCMTRQSRHLASLMTFSPANTTLEITYNKRIRIGYLSPDFGNHPVGLSLVEVLEQADHAKFEIVGLSLMRHPDSVVQSRLVAAFDQFHEVGELAAQSCVQFIRDLELDVLIDLAGHTTDAKPVYLSTRLARVQAGYLGFPGTLGAPWLDYLIADAQVIPEELEAYYAEKIVRLPGSFFPTDTTIKLDGVQCSRQNEGLPEQAFVFCSFGPAKRITGMMMRSWLSILRQVSGSVLWLQKPLDSIVERMRAMAKEEGIDPERLIFARFAADRTEHLARHRLADLYLDTFPYNAHSTGRDALYAGLPLLTLCGRTLPSRVASSLLLALAMPELITYDVGEYQHKAIMLATDRDVLHALRERLALPEVRDGLFNSQRLAHHLGQAYIEMIECAARG